MSFLLIHYILKRWEIFYIYIYTKKTVLILNMFIYKSFYEKNKKFSRFNYCSNV
jgi:hypothetical protein